MNHDSRPAPPESWGGFPAFGAALLWTIFVLVCYFSSIGLAVDLIPAAFNAGAFPPAGFQQALQVCGQSLFILLAGLFITGLTLAWGRRVRYLFSVVPSNGWIGLALDFGLGVLFLDLLWMGLGLARIWFRPLLLGLALALSAALFPDALALWRNRKGRMMDSIPREAAYLFLLAAGAVYWIFSMAQCLAPETFYDSMVYHLAVPQYWFLRHGICDFPTNFFSNYPYGGELYFLNGWMTQGTESAKLLHAVAFGFSALFAGGWAREWGGKSAGWLALGLVLTLPVYCINTSTTQVEGILVLALLPFLYFFLAWLKDDRHPPALGALAGLFLALAFSIKYTSALMVGGVFLSVILLYPFVLKGISPGKWAGFSMGVPLLLGPWILKNALFTGNPFFPYFMSAFEGRHLTPESYGRLLAEQEGWIAHGWQLLYLPWKAVVANPDGFNFTGPIVLAFIPWLFLFKQRHPSFRILALASGLFFLGGFSVTHILRFLGTGFVLLNILLSVVLAGGNKPSWGKGAAWVGSLVAFLCFGYLSAISARYSDCAGIWTGRQTRAEYLMAPGKITPYYATAQWVNQNLPSDAGLLVVGDARGLYYEWPFLTNSVFDEQVLAKAAKEEAAPEGIVRRLKELGVEDLVVNGSEGIRVSADYHHYDLTSEEWKRLDDFIQNDTDLVYQQGFQGVYRIRPTSKSASAEALDLVLFFSRPASQFVKEVQRHQWEAAGEDLNQTLALYPFSKFWKQQKNQFDQSLAQSRR